MHKPSHLTSNFTYLQKIAVQNDKVGEFSLRDCPELVCDSQRFRRVACCCYHNVRRRQSSATEDLHFVQCPGTCHQARIVSIKRPFVPIGAYDESYLGVGEELEGPEQSLESLAPDRSIGPAISRLLGT